MCSLDLLGLVLAEYTGGAALVVVVPTECGDVYVCFVRLYCLVLRLWRVFIDGGG